jgi:two-component system, OmpR family, phosphate regulon sensor histidine kinase PhoR
VSVRPSISEQVSKRPLRLYVVIVAFYGLLLAWWIYFFASLDDRLAEQMRLAGAPLGESQRQALEKAGEETMRMLMFEGGFLGLLVLVSVFFVMRSVERETTLARRQRNFVSAVTHELRSPLASARLYLDSILMGRTDEAKTGRYLKHAREDLDRLGDMVEDILLTRRMSDRKVEVETQVVDLAQQTESEMERLRTLHATHGITLELKTSGPTFAALDLIAFSQILDNLVSNAVKYGGESGPVELAVESASGRSVLTVRDHGPGLGGADPKMLVEPFVRGGDEQVRTSPGVGLGLYIVREFVQAHGGKLSLEDELSGGGTRVSVSFPAVSQQMRDGMGSEASA